MESAEISKPPFPPPEVNKLVCTSLSSFLSEADEFGEVFTKSELDWWIVLKMVNARLLCLLLPPSSSQQSLADVQARSVAIVKTHFEAIFFN
ncbi:hypothetical protein KIN20_030854 [Parelaphostrongylus tenuis]|uniref:Uncharacterized protein n=1 Tax=Parelaphostrongylus tenuis TaxID=148309 RepID=A0AAD5WGT6_PARTN|nr:hypothetical protein KIN20_030854 [Parelaphostrongylus tenuis]